MSATLRRPSESNAPAVAEPLECPSPGFPRWSGRDGMIRAVWACYSRVSGHFDRGTQWVTGENKHFVFSLMASPVACGLPHHNRWTRQCWDEIPISSPRVRESFPAGRARFAKAEDPGRDSRGWRCEKGFSHQPAHAQERTRRTPAFTCGYGAQRNSRQVRGLVGCSISYFIRRSAAPRRERH